MYSYLDYIPDFLRDVREFRIIGDALDPALEEQYAQAVRNYLNQFLDTMDLITITRWEKILSLPSNGTLDERRFAISAKRIRYFPFDKMSLRQILTALCGTDNFSIDIIHSQRLMKIRISLESRNKFDTVYLLLMELKSAAMLLDLSLMYNRHKTLAQFTHKQLSLYAHKELREKRL